MKPAGIILAAGESSRMGRDKALLRFGDSTFLNHLVSLFHPRVNPLIVVLGHHASAIAASLTKVRVKVVVNADYKRGMLTSLQAGLRAIPAEARAVMFTLVDHPAVRGETVDQLVREFQRGYQPLAIPRHAERRGHPVLLSRPIADEILQLPANSSAKDVIRSHRKETLFVDVQDAGVLRDIDLPSDYEVLLRSFAKGSNL